MILEKVSKEKYSSFSLLVVFVSAAFWSLVWFFKGSYIHTQFLKLLNWLPFETVEASLAYLLGLYFIYTAIIVTMLLVTSFFSQSLLEDIRDKHFPYEPLLEEDEVKVSENRLLDILIYVVISIVSFPLLFIPVVNFVLQMGLWIWLIKDTFVNDSMALVIPKEKRDKLSEYKSGFITISAVTALFNFLPVFNIFGPFFGEIAMFYYLKEIQKELWMKIAFFEIKPEEKIFFQQHLKNEELFFFEETTNTVLQESEEYDAVSIFIHSRITDDILEKLPVLQYLQTRSTGYDHIKCEALYKRGLLVSNVAGYGGPAVAEFSFSLLLNATRHTHTAIERSKQRNFAYSDLKGIELFGKTLGILGLGIIGSQMARIGKGFGMKIVAYSRTKKQIVDELGIDFCDLDTVLKKSDILMIALPLTSATNALINEKNVNKIKNDTIIVNTARGEVIEDVLYGKMKNILCLDVISDTKYIHRDNILYTPHMAYYTKEALQRIMQISLENMKAFLEKKPLPNCLKLSCKRDYQ